MNDEPFDSPTGHADRDRRSARGSVPPPPHAADEMEIVFAAMVEPVVIFDARATSRRANPAARAAFGFDPAGIDLASLAEKLSLRHPDGSRVAWAELPAVRALRGEVVNEVYTITNAAGQDAIFDVSVTPMILDGSISGAVAIFQDVTRRKRAEHELADAIRAAENSRLILETIIQQMPAGIIITDASGSVAKNNDEMDRIWRRSMLPDENINRHEYVAFHADGRQYSLEEWPLTRALVHGEVTIGEEMTILRGDGTTGYVLVSSSPIRDQSGNIVAGVVIDMDITDLKVVEQALRTSEEANRHLVQYAPTAIYEIDYRGPRIKTVNEAMCILSGYSREELLSTNPLDLLDSESKTRFQERIRRVLAGEKIDQDVEFGVIAKDGRKLSVILHVKLTYKDGKLDGALVVGYDITERKRAEEALRHQMQIAAALEERQRLARELHDSVSQSLYSIALGARTARALLDYEPGALAEPLDFIVAQAAAGLSDMRALIFDLRPETLAADGLVAALTRRAEFVRQRQGIRVALEMCDEPEVALEVKEGLYSIAREALHNLVKHAHASRVSIRLASCPNGLVLEVGDDGVGFDPLGQFPGHLGLQSMRERAAHLGGTLSIDSASGCGTRIGVRVPRHS